MGGELLNAYREYLKTTEALNKLVNENYDPDSSEQANLIEDHNKAYRNFQYFLLRAQGYSDDKIKEML